MSENSIPESWTNLGEAGVDVLVTTREGGVSIGPYRSLNLGLHVDDNPSAVLENRRRSLLALGAELSNVVFCEQVHSGEVAVVSLDDGGRGATDASTAVPGVDALVTTEAGLVLAILVADCLPAVLVDPVAGVLGVVHAGWRGTAGSVMAHTVEAMCALGAVPERLIAAFGPAVSSDSYEVGDDVITAIENIGLGRALRRIEGSTKRLLDLVAANAAQLASMGLPETAIFVNGSVTGGTGPYFSHREDGPCGRFGLFAQLRPPGEPARIMGCSDPHQERM